MLHHSLASPSPSRAVPLLRGSGLEILEVRPYFTRYRLLHALAAAVSLYVFRDYCARQFLLVGRKPVR